MVDLPTPEDLRVPQCDLRLVRRQHISPPASRRLVTCTADAARRVLRDLHERLRVLTEIRLAKHHDWLGPALPTKAPSTALAAAGLGFHQRLHEGRSCPRCAMICSLVRSPASFRENFVARIKRDG